MVTLLFVKLMVMLSTAKLGILHARYNLCARAGCEAVNATKETATATNVCFMESTSDEQ